MNRPRPSSISGTLFVLAAVVSWGAYFPLAKVVLATVSPTVFLVIRLGVGALTLYLVNLRLGKSLHIKREDWVYVLLAGTVGIILHQLIQLNGLLHTSATNTGWILTLIPPVTGVLGWFWLNEKVPLQTIIGLVVAMFGVTLLVSKGNLTRLSISANHGDLLALASVGTWSVYTVMMKSRLGRYEPLAVAGAHMLLGFVFFAVVGFFSLSQLQYLGAKEWIIAILIGIVPSGLAYYCWAEGLRRLTAIDTAMFLFIEAVVASLTGWIVLGELFTPAMVIATVVIVGGVWIAQHRRKAGRARGTLEEA
jgi:drug/metabolite transporter (DMT)-like permease